MFTITIDNLVIGTLPDNCKVDDLNQLIGKHLFKAAALGKVSVTSSDSFLFVKNKPICINYGLTLACKWGSLNDNIGTTSLQDYFSTSDCKEGKMITIIPNRASLGRNEQRISCKIESDILQQRKQFIDVLKLMTYRLGCNNLASPTLPVELIEIILFKASPLTVKMKDVKALIKDYSDKETALESRKEVTMTVMGMKREISY